ncbi:MAG: hypothetical protein ACNA7J_10590 [Wenzhouxiangella sp.]
MSKLVDLLRDLGKDAKLCAAFKADPDAVCDRYGLDDTQKDAMKAGDVEAVKKASGLSATSLSNGVVTSYE